MTRHAFSGMGRGGVVPRRMAALLWCSLLVGGPRLMSALPPIRALGVSGDSYLDARASAAPPALLDALRRVHRAVPGFSRQTGLPCSACHYQFPQLTPFGRLFKLNGYTMSGLTTIASGDSQHPSLKLSPIPTVSTMVVASLAHTSKVLPEAQNNTTLFPEQASLFIGGEITPRMGAFIQFTYAAPDGAIGIDNVDVRYANHLSWFDKDLLLGATLHNNPTVQDVWNTVPAWTFPFMSSSVMPSPIASTLIDGTLGQQVLGLGGYALWNNLLYAEVTAYRSSQQGTPAPLDSGSQSVISNFIPYGRVALQNTFGDTYLMIGGFGFLGARVYPKGVTGPTDRYTTLGIDAQMEHKLDAGGAMLIGRTSYIHEAQTLDATFAAAEAQSPTADLETFRANVSYLPSVHWSGTLGWFSTIGSADPLRYPSEDFVGSRTGRPNTNGAIGELTWNAWENTRLGLQYTAFTRFNGASDAYDVPGGRRAQDNNTLYLYTWLAF